MWNLQQKKIFIPCSALGIWCSLRVTLSFEQQGSARSFKMSSCPHPSNSCQKVFINFTNFTIVNTKWIVHTTVNSYWFSMSLPLIIVCLRILPFSVCFTMVIFSKSLFPLKMVLWTSKCHFWNVHKNDLKSNFKW